VRDAVASPEISERTHAMSCRLLASLALATLAACASAQAPSNVTSAPPLQRFIIEREIPGASRMSPEQFREGAAKSNGVLRDLGPDIQWIQSFVAGDKVYCIYQAPSEDLIREHAARSGFPANRITPISATLDPTVATARR
jgi:hypothetical protein